MEAFAHQVETHCHECGIPLRREGKLAIGGDAEEYTETHRWIARPKVKDRPTQLVTIQGIPERRERPSTEYLPGTTPGYLRS